MQTTPPPSGDPHARASVLHGSRAALEDMRGTGALEEFADRLPVRTRVATLEKLVLPFEWVAIEHVIAWHAALWEGPAAGDESVLAELVGRSFDLGVARFKSAFFAGVTADRLAERGPELWRWQHTHGEVAVTIEGATAVVVLRDHPYTQNAVSRRITAESYRHIVTLTGVRDVRVAWGGALRDGAARDWSSLVVRLSWRP